MELLREFLPTQVTTTEYTENVNGNRRILLLDSLKGDWGFIRFILRILELEKELEVKFYAEVHIQILTAQQCTRLDRLAHKHGRMIPWKRTNENDPSKPIILLPVDDSDELKWLTTHAAQMIVATANMKTHEIDSKTKRRFFLGITTDEPPEITTGPPTQVEGRKQNEEVEYVDIKAALSDS